VLDVQGGPDVDAGSQQFINILPALGMAAARNICVSIFIDEQQLRPARDGTANRRS